MKNGYGVYKWPNGAYYEGYFKDDRKHGIGLTKYENGKTAYLLWENGKTLRKISEN